MIKEDKIRAAIRLVWRNLPDGTSTSGPCANGCKQGGRGSGPCLQCAEAALAKLAGRAKAKAYVMAVKEIRRLEFEMMECVE